MALIDAIDSYYEHVKTRILNGVINPDGTLALSTDGTPVMTPLNTARKFGGYAEAQTWPPASIDFETLYLVITNQDPETKYGTLGNQRYRTVMQWTWVVQGDDLRANNVGANRGNRFRKDQAIREELRQANFPQFCPLISVGLSTDGASVVRTPYNPIQFCRWTPLSFGPRPAIADQSGVLYGAAAVDVFAFQQPMTQ